MKLRAESPNVGESGDLAPVPELLAGVGGGPCVEKPGCAGSALGSVLAVALEEPRLRLLELVDEVFVVREDRACGFHVAHARKLQLEVDTVALA